MNKLTFFGLLLFLISCNVSSVKENKINESTTILSKIKQMEWVIGKWENITKNGRLYEIWIKTNDSVYSGKSFLIADNDTIFSESISLELKKNELFYIPTVSDQNNGQPITFKFISRENNEMLFENKEHDFPQGIIYKNPKPDSLYVRVEGSDKGKFRKEEFFLKRSRQ